MEVQKYVFGNQMRMIERMSKNENGLNENENMNEWKSGNELMNKYENE